MKNIFDPLFVDPFLDIIGKISEKVSPPAKITFPFYDIIRVSNTEYEIDVALAGFSKSDLSVVSTKDEIIVSGYTELEDRNYTHRGISYRQFERRFSLLDNYCACKASTVDGMLTIRVTRLPMKNFDTITLDIA